MTRAITQYADKTGRPHPTPEAAVTADLAALLGRDFGTAAKVMAKRGEVMALLSELPAGEVVAISVGRRG